MLHLSRHDKSQPIHSDDKNEMMMMRMMMMMRTMIIMVMILMMIMFANSYLTSFMENSRVKLELLLW